MFRFLSIFITVPLTVLVVDFAVSNRGPVEIALFPFAETIETPMYLPVALAAVAGLLVGAFITWVSGHHHRAKARSERKRADKLAASLAEARTAALLKPEPLPEKGETLPLLPY